MPQKSGQNESGQTESLYIAVAILVLIFALAVWMFARGFIIEFAFAIDWVKISAVELVRGLGETGRQHKIFVEATLDGRVSPWSVTFDEFLMIRSTVGQIVAPFIALPIAIMAGVIGWKMKGRAFTRKFSLARNKKGLANFADYQAEHWKVAFPGAKFDPDNAPKIEDPARTPFEWMRDNGIALNAKGLDREATEKAFALQIGEHWPGFASAPIYVRGLAVMCALNASRHKATREFKEKLALIWAGPEKDREKATEVLYLPYLKDPKIIESIDKIAEGHAFTSTVMAALLLWARKKGGVTASAEFRWLKAVDRSLWYTLNNVGRRAFHVEGAGPTCHFFAEQVIQRKLPDPFVEKAVEGLQMYIDDHGIEDLEAFFNGKN
jgi:intracellular multiplication protein IcmP